MRECLWEQYPSHLENVKFVRTKLLGYIMALLRVKVVRDFLNGASQRQTNTNVSLEDNVTSHLKIGTDVKLVGSSYVFSLVCRWMVSFVIETDVKLVCTSYVGGW